MTTRALVGSSTLLVRVEEARRLGKLLAGLVSDRGFTRRFRRGAILFHQGDSASSVHVITSGRVAVRLLTEEGETVTVAVAGPGDVLGELALLTPEGRRGATAEALDDVETTVIDRSTFGELRATTPGLTDRLVALLAERVRHLDEQLIEALHVRADVRVVRRLDELAVLYGDLVPLRQEDLAGMAGTTRATVNRVLARFARSGVLDLQRSQIRILDRVALAEAARRPASSR